MENVINYPGIAIVVRLRGSREVKQKFFSTLSSLKDCIIKGFSIEKTLLIFNKKLQEAYPENSTEYLFLKAFSQKNDLSISKINRVLTQIR